MWQLQEMIFDFWVKMWMLGLYLPYSMIAKVNEPGKKLPPCG